MAENEEFQNILYTGDNLYILEGLETESVDLIYLDPPFNTKRTFSAPIGSKAAGTSFTDMWTWKDVDRLELAEMHKIFPDLVHYIETIENIHSKAMMSYITYMAQRVIEMHRILKPTGSLYYHCDPTAGHFVKLMLDCIFGKKNFRNEIIWSYNWGGRSDTYFPRKHDLIYMFVKDRRQTFFYGDDIRIPYKTQVEGRTKPLVSKEKFEKGQIPTDVWQIPIVHAMSKERTGYPTQKPLALLERIIKASCPEGGIVLDPFCGCATTCVEAQILGRKWIGIDIEEQAVDLLIQRLSEGNVGESKGIFKDFIATPIVPIRSDKKVPNAPKTRPEMIEYLAKKQDLKTENGAKQFKCNGCKHYYLLKDAEIDHIIPRAKGGPSSIENYQLLCGNCNRTKNQNSMKELRKVLEERRKQKEMIWYDSE